MQPPPHVLLLTPRLHKSARKLASTAAMFDAVGAVTLTCLVGVKVGAVAVRDRDRVFDAGVLDLAQRPDDPVELWVCGGGGVAMVLSASYGGEDLFLGRSSAPSPAPIGLYLIHPEEPGASV